MPLMYVPSTGLSFVSYPKCGRTWMRHIITHAISLYYQIDCQNPLDTSEAARKAGLTEIIISHNQAEWGPYREARNMPEPQRRGLIRSYDDMLFQEEIFNDQKVIFMVRDPRDVLVSAYFQMTRVEGSYKGLISEFVRDGHLR